MDLIAQGMPVAFALWVFAVGAVVGSFLNVVIARVPKGESVVSPGSRCPRPTPAPTRITSGNHLGSPGPRGLPGQWLTL